MTATAPVRRLGVVTHPTRDVSGPLDTVRAWARDHDQVELVDGGPSGAGADGRAPDAAGCDAALAIGGDGTLLAALHAGEADRVPVLGVASGSLAALGVVAEEELTGALDRLGDGDFAVRQLPALTVFDSEGTRLDAFNDTAISRDAGGQVSVGVSVDGELYARLAGDGLVVSTPLGSTAYCLAAGGPVLDPLADAFVLTPLPSHGGFCPPLVLSSGRELEVVWLHGHDQCRIEVDGRPSSLRPGRLRVALGDRPAQLIALGDDPFPRPLRRRRIVLDSPRVAVLAGEDPAG